ncbi:hypothetical protein J5X98_02140 [Leptothermofonsia sichuanensis E412]|uniref:hypothetical protein n=1 Tax=Leptothermofonsia sichuanensis TaxID=2917832 RepID=UPI001CA66F66|nr:hypothetical protein [Leptothermofonsia sichuanensis]QZZ21306.1 hypothetical protein J5X98_02140 [Leptothermofonsia sichuanensis E412]
MRSGTLPKLDILQGQFGSEARYQAFLNRDWDLAPTTRDFATTLKALMLDE